MSDGGGGHHRDYGFVIPGRDIRDALDRLVAELQEADPWRRRSRVELARELIWEGINRRKSVTSR